MKKSFEKFKGACLYMVCGIIGWLPFHTLRILLLRILKAKISFKAGMYRGFEIRSPWKLKIGRGTIVGHNALLDARMGLIIGNNVNISNEVMIWTLHHDCNSSDFAQTGQAVIIEDYVWLCSRTVILPGVTIGEGAVVAAGAVVTKNVLPYTVVGGIPAKQIAIRNRNLNYDLSSAVLPII
nr:acyltransferase [Mucilaginibacter sp. FT3.2]MBB6232530.1 acetyltransferase-like isoleucine patch superfamily enzyme [Mucilaginibacter sp. FT3.2]